MLSFTGPWWWWSSLPWEACELKRRGCWFRRKFRAPAGTDRLDAAANMTEEMERRNGWIGWIEKLFLSARFPPPLISEGMSLIGDLLSQHVIIKS